MEKENFYILVVEGIDETQRRLVGNAIKMYAPEWWHQMYDVWVFSGGGESTTWSERLAMIIDEGRFLLMQLQQPGSWASRLPEGQSDWFREIYTGTKPKTDKAPSPFDEHPPFFDPSPSSFSEEPPF